MKKRYLVSRLKPGLEFEVVAKRTDEDGNMLFTLLGSHNVPFERTITDEILNKYGYFVDVRELPDPPPT